MVVLKLASSGHYKTIEVVNSKIQHRFSVSLVDPESNQCYTLRLSPQDVQKAKTDMVVANALLRYAQSFPPKVKAATVGNKSTSVAPQATALVVPIIPTVPIPLHIAAPKANLSTTTRRSKVSGINIAPKIATSKTIQPEAEVDVGVPNTLQVTQHTIDDDGIYNWSKAQSRLLIDLYRGNEALFTDSGLSQKQAWENISALMAKKGHIIPGRKCDSKFQSLKRTYKSVRDHNNKSGNSKKSWEYFDDMENIFKKKPWVEPSSTAGSDHVNCDNPDDPTMKPKPAKSKQADYLKELLTHKKKRSITRDAQHTEKLKALADLRDLMRQHLNNST